MEGIENHLPGEIPNESLRITFSCVWGKTLAPPERQLKSKNGSIAGIDPDEIVYDFYGGLFAVTDNGDQVILPYPLYSVVKETHAIKFVFPSFVSYQQSLQELELGFLVCNQNLNSFASIIDFDHINDELRVTERTYLAPQEQQFSAGNDIEAATQDLSTPPGYFDQQEQNCANVDDEKKPSLPTDKCELNLVDNSMGMCSYSALQPQPNINCTSSNQNVALNSQNSDFLKITTCKVKVFRNSFKRRAFQILYNGHIIEVFEIPYQQSCAVLIGNKVVAYMTHPDKKDNDRSLDSRKNSTCVIYAKVIAEILSAPGDFSNNTDIAGSRLEEIGKSDKKEQLPELNCSVEHIKHVIVGLLFVSDEIEREKIKWFHIAGFCIFILAALAAVIVPIVMTVMPRGK